jgi:hypothetical protein
MTHKELDFGVFLPIANGKIMPGVRQAFRAHAAA